MTVSYVISALIAASGNETLGAVPEPGQQPSTKFDKERAQQRYREARAFGPASEARTNLCSEPLLLPGNDPKRFLQAQSLDRPQMGRVDEGAAGAGIGVLAPA